MEYIYTTNEQTMQTIINQVINKVALINSGYQGTTTVTVYHPTQPNDNGMSGFWFNYTDILPHVTEVGVGVVETIKVLVQAITAMSPHVNLNDIPAPLQNAVQIKHITTDTPEDYGFVIPNPEEE